MSSQADRGPDWWANKASMILRQSLGEDRFPIDVERLALEWTPVIDRDAPVTRVSERPLDGCDGALVDGRRRGKGWGIAYSDAIRHPGRRRFTVAHELGHFLVHRHLAPDGGFRCWPEDMATWDHERSPQEAEANRFAARLLMPLDDFRRQVPARARVSLAELGRLAEERYGVSITACVLQWLSLTERRAVLVMSRDGYVLWGKSSTPALRSGAFFRTRGRSPMEVPTASPAATGASEIPPDGVSHPAGVWFSGEPVVEEVIVSDRYDLGLSLLHLEDRVRNFEQREEEALDTFDLMEQRSNR